MTYAQKIDIYQTIAAFGVALQEAMSKRGHQNSEVAERTGASLATVTNWRSGYCAPADRYRPTLLKMYPSLRDALKTVPVRVSSKNVGRPRSR